MKGIFFIAILPSASYIHRSYLKYLRSVKYDMIK